MAENLLPVALNQTHKAFVLLVKLMCKFFARKVRKNPGVVNTAGEVIGEHKGLWFYTIGQRHGTLQGKIRKENNEWKHVVPPFYVIAKMWKNG